MIGGFGMAETAKQQFDRIKFERSVVDEESGVVGYFNDDDQFLIERLVRLEEALSKIVTRKMSTYLSSSAMNQDFIRTAQEALDGE